MFKITLSLITAITAILFFSASAFAASGRTDCAQDSHYPLITKAELKKVVDSKSATIFDVNSKESYAKVHVPGAIHYGSYENDFAHFLPKDKNSLIIAYCGGTQCEAWKTAAERACRMGYTNIRHYKEGITGWVKPD